MFLDERRSAWDWRLRKLQVENCLGMASEKLQVEDYLEGLASGSFKRMSGAGPEEEEEEEVRRLLQDFISFTAGSSRSDARPPTPPSAGQLHVVQVASSSSTASRHRDRLSSANRPRKNRACFPEHHSRLPGSMGSRRALGRRTMESWTLFS